MNATKVSDLDRKGRHFWIDGDTVRDDNGKVVGGRISEDAEALTLSDATSRLMRGEQVRADKGRLVTLADLAPGDVASATAARAAFGPIPLQEFIADDVAPVCMVEHDRGSWWKESAADSIIAALAVGIAGGGAPGEIAPAFASTAFVCAAYGLACRIPAEVSQNADFDIKLMALRRIVAALRLAREQRVAKLLTTSASWATANVVSATSKWDGGVSNDPLADIFAAKATSILAATALVITEPAERFFHTASTVRDFVQSGGKLPRILVGRALAQVSGSPSYVWGTPTSANAALIREVADPKTEIGTARTLRWLGLSRDGVEKDGFLVRTFRTTEDAGRQFDFVSVVHNDSEIMVSNQVGSLITGALA